MKDSRIHLQHGPIDLIIGARGEHELAFDAAKARFNTVLEELVAELPELRSQMQMNTPKPTGETAVRMHNAAKLLLNNNYLTRMIAVAGSVAETVLDAMVRSAMLDSAYVNNGGDIALHLAKGQHFNTAIARIDGADLGRIKIHHNDAVRGIATSGRHGRSFSLGIADSVTVLAHSASVADAAATLIANAVDLPEHPLITRRAAADFSDDTDLKEQQVVTHCAQLSACECEEALNAGLAYADTLLQRGTIVGAALFLQNEVKTIGFSSQCETTEDTQLTDVIVPRIKTQPFSNSTSNC